MLEIITFNNKKLDKKYIKRNSSRLQLVKTLKQYICTNRTNLN